MSSSWGDVEMAESSEQPDLGYMTNVLEDIFTEELREGLPHYNNVEQLLQSLRLMETLENREQRWSTCIRRVTHFARAAEPLVAIVSLAKPDMQVYLWDLLHLLLKIGWKHGMLLERACDMLRAIGVRLPKYDGLWSAWKLHLNAGQREEIGRILCFMYAGILEFCLQLYCIFAGTKSRIEEYYARSPNTPPLHTKSAQLQHRLSNHRRWVETFNSIRFDIARKQEHDQRDHFESSSEAYNETYDVGTRKESPRVGKADKIKSWLSASYAYRSIYEHKARQRHVDSCSWFLQMPEFRRWKNSAFFGSHDGDGQPLKADWRERVLFVQAPAGLGKTVLSSKVVDTLSAETHDSSLTTDPSTIASFHFNSLHPRCTHPDDGLRALAEQLIHHHCQDKQTSDLLSLLSWKLSSQTKASPDDVVSVLSLLLQQHPTFLIIDGVDECSDADSFLSTLSDLCRQSDAHALVFSRPHIRIPSVYGQWPSPAPHIMRLTHGQNVADIAGYLNEHLRLLADQGCFGVDLNRFLITKAIKQASGSFLWASLLVKYLQTPDLHPRERLAILERVDEYRGTSSLYRHILRTLSARSEEDTMIASDTFRWLAFSIQGFCSPKLQDTLSIHCSPAPSMDSKSHIIDLLPQLTCSLIEVIGNDVVFTHRSVQEYLQSKDCESPTFNLYDANLAHAHLAARCLQYLIERVPQRPLQQLQPWAQHTPSQATGSSASLSIRTGTSCDSGYISMNSTPETNGPVLSIDSTMPFLRYAALCWPVHLTKALSQYEPASQQCTSPLSSPPLSTTSPTEAQNRTFANHPYLPILSRFLSDRTAVTTWVEASYRYSLPPNLSRLLPLLMQLKAEVLPASVESRELGWVLRELKVLNAALRELKDGYSGVLMQNPSLVWQVGGWAGMESRGFWPLWEG